MEKKNLAQPIQILMEHGANGAHEGSASYQYTANVPKCEMMNGHNKKNEETGN